jgi:hypothetical protein
MGGIEARRRIARGGNYLVKSERTESALTFLGRPWTGNKTVETILLIRRFVTSLQTRGPKIRVADSAALSALIMTLGPGKTAIRGVTPTFGF